MWRRPPGRPRNKWLDQLRNDSTRPTGDLLSTVDMVVQRRDGPRWLRKLNDDDILMQWSHETMFAIAIFEICRQLLGASPPDPTGAPPLDPAGRLHFRSQTPWFCPPVASLPASGPWAPPAERGPLLESIYRVSLTVGVCKGNKIFSFTKFISPQPVGGPSKRKKIQGPLGTCPLV